jgi:hypothetical protein
LAAIRQEYVLQVRLDETWDETLFLEKYVPAVVKAEQVIRQHDEFARWLDHLHDALELVDLRSGEIRDRATNAWLLEEVLQGMEQIEHPQVRQFVRTLRNCSPSWTGPPGSCSPTKTCWLRTCLTRASAKRSYAPPRACGACARR